MTDLKNMSVDELLDHDGHEFIYREVVDELARRLREQEDLVISGFYEDEIPQYRQGVPAHELESVVTAKEVTGLVTQIVNLKKRANREKE